MYEQEVELAGLHAPIHRSALDQFKDRKIRNLPTPSAIVDRGPLINNCERMLKACKTLDLEFRAHVKTHKTKEITELQLQGQGSAKIIVSTFAEVEFLLPLLKSYKEGQQRDVNVLYGLPLGGECNRLGEVARVLGEGSISVLIDHEQQFGKLESLMHGSGGIIPHVFIKIDMGGRRAGISPGTEQFHEVMTAALHHHGRGLCKIVGLYSHAGHSYGGDSAAAATRMLIEELSALLTAAEYLQKFSQASLSLTLSVGATPTALSIQNVELAAAASSDVQEATTQLSFTFDKIRQEGHKIEIHAGVYPLLDLQQLAAHSLTTSQLSWSNLALTVLAEVISVYPGRGTNGTDEYLINAGSLALGREFCKAYDGFAKVTPWAREGVAMPTCEVEDDHGWQVGRISQEHGILTWSGKAEDAEKDPGFTIGQKIRLWPNHACITSSHFGWYYVVSSQASHEHPGLSEEVVEDCWVKARGW